MTRRIAPQWGAVLTGRDRPGRALRVTSHPEHDRVVLSLWDRNHCIGTIRLAPGDVPDLVASLTASVLPGAADVGDGPRTGVIASAAG